MSQRTVTDCDACKAKAIGSAIRIDVPVGTRSDPATGRVEERTEAFDLCRDCAEALLRDEVSRWSVCQGRGWAGRIGRKQVAG